jgi:hypothetical protein
MENGRGRDETGLRTSELCFGMRSEEPELSRIRISDMF